VANENKIMGALFEDSLPKLQQDFPGLRYEKGGEQKRQMEEMRSLGYGFLFASIVIFGLLAVAFRSYIQPFIIMTAIPFGLVGAIMGHIIMGFDLSLISMMGIVALAGIVVNDSLILIVATNKYVGEGYSAFEAIELGAKRRFRPIILTSVTTFLGLTPMILETSVQARFLIPMAISLGFGVLFATAIVLVLVPCVYLALEDSKAGILGLLPSSGVADLDSEKSST